MTTAHLEQNNFSASVSMNYIPTKTTSGWYYQPQPYYPQSFRDICSGCGRCNKCGREDNFMIPYYNPYPGYPQTTWSTNGTSDNADYTVMDCSGGCDTVVASQEEE